MIGCRWVAAAPGQPVFERRGALAVAVFRDRQHELLGRRHLRVAVGRDRRGAHAGMGRLLRFHLSNGMVSLVGNLLLMRLLVQEVHLPVLVSNGIAILCCSLVNFYVGNRWTFAVVPTKHRMRHSC